MCLYWAVNMFTSAVGFCPFKRGTLGRLTYFFDQSQVAIRGTAGFCLNFALL